jgi:protein TilB
MVSTLEEVALHQQSIEKIELLGQVCPNLKILYLQNNLISKIQNLHKLKVIPR